MSYTCIDVLDHIVLATVFGAQTSEQTSTLQG